MKKLLVLLAAALLVLSACNKKEVVDIMTDETGTEVNAQTDETMSDDMSDENLSDDSMSDEDAMMDDASDGMVDANVDATVDTAVSVSGFVPYTEDAIANANGKVVLAFFAEWCPTCNAAEKDLRANGDQIPEDVTILEVNYDDATTLKEKYNVTSQHTFVQVDSAGELIKKWRGGERVTEIIAQIQ